MQRHRDDRAINGRSHSGTSGVLCGWGWRGEWRALKCESGSSVPTSALPRASWMLSEDLTSLGLSFISCKNDTSEVSDVLDQWTPDIIKGQSLRVFSGELEFQQHLLISCYSKESKDEGYYILIKEEPQWLFRPFSPHLLTLSISCLPSSKDCDWELITTWGSLFQWQATLMFGKCSPRLCWKIVDEEWMSL